MHFESNVLAHVGLTPVWSQSGRHRPGIVGLVNRGTDYVACPVQFTSSTHTYWKAISRLASVLESGLLSHWSRSPLPTPELNRTLETSPAKADTLSQEQ